MSNNDNQLFEGNSKKRTRTSKILDEVSHGRKLKLMKLKDKINTGEYQCHDGLLEVFEEVMDDAKKDKYE